MKNKLDKLTRPGITRQNAGLGQELIERKTLDECRNNLVQRIDNVLKFLDSECEKGKINPKLKDDASEFYTKIKDNYAGHSVQELIDNKNEIQLYSGNMITTSGLLLLSQTLRKNNAGSDLADEIPQIIFLLTQAHRDIYTSYKPMKDSIEKLQEHASPVKETTEVNTDVESDLSEDESSTFRHKDNG